MEKIVTKRKKGLQGEISVPGDKSISHRAIILGSLAEGKTIVQGLCRGEDNLRTVNAFRKMGTVMEEGEGIPITIHGRGLAGLSEPDDFIYAGNSGTTMRLLSGVLSGQDFFSVISGDDSLRKRPMDRVVKPLTSMGASIFGRENGRFAPLAITGKN